MYNIKKNIDKIKRGEHTFFLDPTEVIKIKGHLKRNEYNVYYPYPESNKVILYQNKLPKVILFEIKSKIPLRHQDILGTIFSLDITNEVFGDIIVDNNKYYIFVLDIIAKYIKSNLLFIKNTPVELEEIDINRFNTSKVKMMKGMFLGSKIRQDIDFSKLYKCFLLIACSWNVYKTAII